MRLNQTATIDQNGIAEFRSPSDRLGVVAELAVENPEDYLPESVQFVVPDEKLGPQTVTHPVSKMHWARDTRTQALLPHAAVGFCANALDVLTRVVFDPSHAGKTVTVTWQI